MALLRRVLCVLADLVNDEDAVWHVEHDVSLLVTAVLLEADGLKLEGQVIAERAVQAQLRVVLTANTQTQQEKGGSTVKAGRWVVCQTVGGTIGRRQVSSSP
jgi:hypothetical protein